MKLDDNLPLMTWHARPDMSCEHVNRAWLEYTGYTLEQALGEGWSRALHPEDLAPWLDTCVRAFDERKPFEIEYRLRRRDGEYRWFCDRAAPRYAEGVFVGYGGVCVDIDAQKRDRQNLARELERERRLRISMEEGSRLRHSLVISVLRELQAPAQALATWARQLGQDGIERSARAQERIISSLLDLAHAQAQSAQPGGLAEEPLLAGVRVLVMEKDPAARASLVDVLGFAGADVRVAASPAEALETLGAWRPDVLLSDSDDSFIRALRSLPAERGGCLRAAALTDGPARSAVASGYDAQLEKPVEPVALLATVARLAA
jgi:PAS domain S-box-containing protein